ncbi:MAG: hypothetical protein AB7T49_16385 [Oligoflexales bacterium]
MKQIALLAAVLFFAGCKTHSGSMTMSDGGKPYRTSLESAADFEALQAPLPDDPESYMVKHYFDFSDGHNEMYFIDTKAYPYHDKFHRDIVTHYGGDEYLDLASFPAPKKISVGSLHYLPEFTVVNAPAKVANIYEGKKGVMAFSVYHNIVDASQECVNRKYSQDEIQEILQFQKKLRETATFVEQRTALVVCTQEFFPNKKALNEAGIVVYSYNVLKQH